MNRLNAKKKKKTIKLPKTESHTLKAVEVKMKRTGIICIEKRKKKKRSSCKCRDSDLPKTDKGKEKVKKDVGHVNRCRVAGHSWEETSKYIQEVVNDSLFQPEEGGV